jgi:hypothetical protein
MKSITRNVIENTETNIESITRNVLIENYIQETEG